MEATMEMDRLRTNEMNELHKDVIMQKLNSLRPSLMSSSEEKKYKSLLCRMDKVFNRTLNMTSQEQLQFNAQTQTSLDRNIPKFLFDSRTRLNEIENVIIMREDALREIFRPHVAVTQPLIQSQPINKGICCILH